MTPDGLTTAERRALRRQAFRRIHEEWSRHAITYPFLDQQIASLRSWRWAHHGGRVSP
jgi:hypothetical protein